MEKDNNYQFRILYPLKISSKSKVEIKLRKFVTSQLALKGILRAILQAGKMIFDRGKVSRSEWRATEAVNTCMKLNEYCVFKIIIILWPMAIAAVLKFCCALNSCSTKAALPTGCSWPMTESSRETKVGPFLGSLDYSDGRLWVKDSLRALQSFP